MYEYRARLTKVSDGDTLRLDIDLGFDFWYQNQSVRLYGINAPEMSTPEGKVAKDFAIAWFGQLNVPLVIRTYKDASEKYGRWLVTVWKGTGPRATADSLNWAMIANGHAVEYLP